MLMADLGRPIPFLANVLFFYGTISFSKFLDPPLNCRLYTRSEM